MDGTETTPYCAAKTTGEPTAFEVQVTDKVYNGAENEADDVYMLKSFDRGPWIKRARYVSYLSIAFTLVGGVVGIVIAGLSSRFWSEDIEEQKQSRLYQKEKKASVGIAFMLVLIGFVVGIQATVHLAEEHEPNRATELLIISTISLACLTALAAVKFKISSALKSSAMKKDAITSAAVAMLSFGILLSAAIFNSHPNIWWLDSTFAVVVSLLLISYGTRTLIKNKWWKKQFWEKPEQ